MLVSIFYLLPLLIPFLLALSVTSSVRMILTMNIFIVVGTYVAHSHVNLLLGYFGAIAFKNAPFQPHTWLRYLSVIFLYDLGRKSE